MLAFGSSVPLHSSFLKGNQFILQENQFMLKRDQVIVKRDLKRDQVILKGNQVIFKRDLKGNQFILKGNQLILREVPFISGPPISPPKKKISGGFFNMKSTLRSFTIQTRVDTR